MWHIRLIPAFSCFYVVFFLFFDFFFFWCDEGNGVWSYFKVPWRSVYLMTHFPSLSIKCVEIDSIWYFIWMLNGPSTCCSVVSISHNFSPAAFWIMDNPFGLSLYLKFPLVFYLAVCVCVCAFFIPFSSGSFVPVVLNTSSRTSYLWNWQTVQVLCHGTCTHGQHTKYRFSYRHHVHMGAHAYSSLKFT